MLDSGGEYARNGKAESRPPPYRGDVFGLFNDELKHDFAARFTLRVEVPGLNERREDIPLLLGLLLRQAASSIPDVAGRYFDADDKRPDRPRIAPVLVAYLVRHTYSLHMREPMSLLWKAVLSSSEDLIGTAPGVKAEFEKSGVSRAVKPSELTQQTVTESPQRHDGKITRAAKKLALKNGYVLYRLTKKLGTSE